MSEDIKLAEQPVTKTVEPKNDTPRKAIKVDTKNETDWQKAFQELETKFNTLLYKRETERQEEPKQAAPKAPNIKRSQRFDIEKETALVKGMFHFHAMRGKTMTWWEKFPWPGAKMKKYEAKDNTILEIPYYVARRLMIKGQVPVYGEVKDANGKMFMKVKEYRRRFDFFPMGTFIHVDQPNRIIRPHTI